MVPFSCNTAGTKDVRSGTLSQRTGASELQFGGKAMKEQTPLKKRQFLACKAESWLV